MLKPTIKDLTKDQYNRYELTLATAKAARQLTDEYVRQREEAEKAIKNAITRINDGRYEIYREENTATEVVEEVEVTEEA